MHRTTVAVISAICVLVLVAAGLAGIGLVERSEAGRSAAVLGTPTASVPLSDLQESMLIDEDSVPALAGSSWGRITGAPQGAEPAVTPPQCALLLSRGPASRKAMALRSAKSAAIGVELAITATVQDLPVLLDECRSFTFGTPTTRSSVDVETQTSDDLPAGAVSAVLHCRREEQGRALEWDIALVAGYRRGVFVVAVYTPGPLEPTFDSALAGSLDDIYRAQIARLDEV